MRRKVFHIYASWRHLLATILTLLIPVIFLWVFSGLAKIAVGSLFTDFLISFSRIAVAYIIAAALAWVLAASFYHGRRGEVALPIFDVLQSLPTFALLPAAVLVLGRGSLTVTIFLVLVIIWPIFFALISALKLIKHDWEEAVAIGGLRGFNYLRYFLWPVSFPALVSGSIVGLGEAWEALIATEIIVQVKNGLGPFFNQSATNVTITTFGVLGVLLLVFSLNKIIWLPLLEKSHRMMEE